MACFKAEGLPNLATPATVPRMWLRDNPLACDRQEVHEVYPRWRALADAYSPWRVLIGEVNLAPARVARYTRLDELHQAFAFAFLGAPWDARAWQSIISGLLKFQVRGGAPVTWAVENHGVVIQDFEPLRKFDSCLTLGRPR
jgi:alpha-glucosidase